MDGFVVGLCALGALVSARRGWIAGALGSVLVAFVWIADHDAHRHYDVRPLTLVIAAGLVGAMMFIARRRPQTKAPRTRTR